MGHQYGFKYPAVSWQVLRSWDGDLSNVQLYATVLLSVAFIYPAGRYVYQTDDHAAVGSFWRYHHQALVQVLYWPEAATTGGTDMLAALIQGKVPPLFRCADHAGIRRAGSSSRCNRIWRSALPFMH